MNFPGFYYNRVGLFLPIACNQSVFLRLIWCGPCGHGELCLKIWCWVQNFADMVAAKAVQQKRKAAERKEGKAKKTKESFKF